MANSPVPIIPSAEFRQGAGDGLQRLRGLGGALDVSLTMHMLRGGGGNDDGQTDRVRARHADQTSESGDIPSEPSTGHSSGVSSRYQTAAPPARTAR